VSSKILTALFLVGGASALYAGPVYSCGGGSACDGNLYAVWVVSQTATSYVLDVGVQVTNNYLTANGGPGSTLDRIDGLAIIPDNNGTYTSSSLTAHPGGAWSLQSGGLNAGGCSGSGAPYVCAGSSNMGAMLFTYNPITNTNSPNTLIFQFTITGTPPSLGDTAHIKYHFINSIGTNVGSLGSFDVAIQCIGGGNCVGGDPPSGVPEPVTSALVGSGLVGLYFIRRRLPGSR
jgi:hypothetical protein